MSNPLQKYKILVADADQRLAQVLRGMLVEMGFPNVGVTRSGLDAIKYIQDSPVDFLITEWSTADIDGIEMLNRIRRDPASPNPTLPIIMLTGRAEASDVVVARDHGINEYVVKPFSAKTVYNRLERIVEHPRQFVIAQQFVGPDRRHKGSPPEGVDERRQGRIIAQRTPKDSSREIKNGPIPKIWMPDFTLKEKLGKNVDLPSLITPAVLNLAQASIDAITSDSLQWIREDVTELKARYTAMAEGKNPATGVADLGETALLINSRAGTFGYANASEVAYMLYLFCRNTLKAEKQIHCIIAEKHIEVLQVILSNNMRGAGGSEGSEITGELRNLVKKYGQ